MVEAEVINPEGRKRALKCCDCDMTYSVKDYGILFEREKLIYFKFKPQDGTRSQVHCHGCLLNAIHKSYPFDEIDLKIIDDEYEYICKYYAEDVDDDSDFLSGLEDIFKK